jgi:hypothetical protein
MDTNLRLGIMMRARLPIFRVFQMKFQHAAANTVISPVPL